MEQKGKMEQDSGFILKDVSLSYKGKAVIPSLSFHLKPGTRWGILGPSGSGKSTLIRLIAGLEAPDAGEIYLDGNLVSEGCRIRTPPRYRHIAMVFQDLALWPNLTAMENVTLGIHPGRHGKDVAVRRACKSLEICGIAGLADRYPSELSGGEQQRLALARALAASPRYLFLDEPFSGLDIEIKTAIIREIKTLTANQDITTILVSHDPLEVLGLCRKVLVLEKGEIIEMGDFRQLLQGPQSALLNAFRQYLKTLGSSSGYF